MKLIRFGEINKEKPGVILSNGSLLINSRGTGEWKKNRCFRFCNRL